MPEIDDSEVRAAAIVFVQRLRDRHGGRIPGRELSRGISLGGRRIPVWNQQKGIFKPAVLGRAGAALSIQTSISSPYGDRHDSAAGLIAYKYRGDNPLHADNVALRRAMELQVPLIYLVAVDPGVYDAVIPVYAVEDRPAELEFALQVDIAQGDAYTADLVRAQARREYETRAVLQRLHQGRFRRLVLDAYRGQCGICRLRHLELLDAAHILPDRHPLGEPVVSNGLGLCKIHHSAYDASIIGIDADAVVHVREDILAEVDGPMLRHGLQEIQGSRLVLPRSDESKPNRAYLSERFAKFLAA